MTVSQRVLVDGIGTYVKQSFKGGIATASGQFYTQKYSTDRSRNNLSFVSLDAA